MDDELHIPNILELAEQDLKQRQAARKGVQKRKRRLAQRKRDQEKSIFKAAGLPYPPPRAPAAAAPAAMSSSTKKSSKRSAASAALAGLKTTGLETPTPAAKRRTFEDGDDAFEDSDDAPPSASSSILVARTVEKRLKRREKHAERAERFLFNKTKVDKEITADWNNKANEAHEKHQSRLDKNRKEAMDKNAADTQALLGVLDKLEQGNEDDEEFLINYQQSLTCHHIATPKSTVSTPAATRRPSSRAGGGNASASPGVGGVPPVPPSPAFGRRGVLFPPLGVEPSSTPLSPLSEAVEDDDEEQDSAEKVVATTDGLVASALTPWLSRPSRKRLGILLGYGLPVRDSIKAVDTTQLDSVLPKTKFLLQVADCTVLFTRDGLVIPAIYYAQPGTLMSFLGSKSGPKFATEPIDFGDGIKIVDVRKGGSYNSLVAYGEGREVFVVGYEGSGKFQPPTELPVQATDIMGYGETTLFGFNRKDVRDEKKKAPLLRYQIDGGSALRSYDVGLALPQARVWAEPVDGSDRCLMVASDKKNNRLVYSRWVDASMRTKFARDKYFNIHDKVVKVAAGDGHALALTKEGKLYYASNLGAPTGHLKWKKGALLADGANVASMVVGDGFGMVSVGLILFILKFPTTASEDTDEGDRRIEIFSIKFDHEVVDMATHQGYASFLVSFDDGHGGANAEDADEDSDKDSVDSDSNEEEADKKIGVGATQAA